jgi:hypothetical protein
MIVTVDEAKTKWCPAEDGGGRCSATECMAWRWSKVPEDNRKPSTGYCGLAGRPISTEKLLINVGGLEVFDEKTIDQLIEKLEERVKKNDVDLRGAP